MNYLIYSSHRKANCTEEEIDHILQTCKKNNPEKNLTGILLHSKNYFLQYVVLYLSE
ncbi:MAG: BLUF domain-containing protein [Aureispira sp.]